MKFPQIHSLSMVNYQPDILLRHLNGMIIEGFIYILDSAISCLVDQITHLTADIYLNRGELPNHLEVILCVAILFYCRYLTDLTFSQRPSKHLRRVIFHTDVLYLQHSLT